MPDYKELYFTLYRSIKKALDEPTHLNIGESIDILHRALISGNCSDLLRSSESDRTLRSRQRRRSFTDAACPLRVEPCPYEAARQFIHDCRVASHKM